MRFSHRVEYALFRALRWLIGALPLGAVRTAGAWAGASLSRVLSSRWATAMENLAYAFPGWTDAELRRTARSSFRSVGTTFFELAWFDRMTRERLASIVTTVNPEVVREAVDEGRGVIVLTAHLGSWELFAQAVGPSVGRNAVVVVKTQANPFVDSDVDALRRRLGLVTVPMPSFGREGLRVLGAGGIVIIAGDQSAPRESFMVPFFGRTVSTFKGPAVFAVRTGAALVFGAAVRSHDGNYQVTFERIRYDDLTGPEDVILRDLTARHVATAEKAIREAPGQWMWMHRRWKHLADERPADGAA